MKRVLLFLSLLLSIPSICLAGGIWANTTQLKYQQNATYWWLNISAGSLTDNLIASSGNWNTAFSWGNHAAAGYATQSNLTTHINNAAVHVSSGNRTAWDDAAAILAAGIPLYNLSDVNASSPNVNDALVWDGVKWVNKPPTTVTGAGSRIFFLNDTASDIAGYGFLAPSPVFGIEHYDNMTVNNNQTLIQSYITPSGGLGHPTIEAGIWEFPTYCNVSSITGTGISQVKIYVYTYAANNTETELFNTTTGSITSSNVTLYDVVSVQGPFATNTTDRLAVKYYANTTHTSAKSVGFFHGGTTRYTTVNTPINVHHNDLEGLQGGQSGEFYHMNASEASGNWSGKDFTASMFFGDGGGLTNVSAPAAGNPLYINNTTDNSSYRINVNTDNRFTLTTEQPVYPDTSKTVLMIHFNEVNGTGVAHDSSQYNHTILNTTFVSADTVDKIFGNASFDLQGNGGNSGWVQTNGTADLNPLDKDWAISFWIKLKDNATASYIFDQSAGPYESIRWVYYTPSNGFRYFCPGNQSINLYEDDSSGVASNTWYHIEFDYQSVNQTIQLYRNGTLVKSSTAVGNFTVGDYPAQDILAIGYDRYDNNQNVSYYWIDEFQYHVGEVLHTDNFTIPNTEWNPGTASYKNWTQINITNTTVTLGNPSNTTTVITGTNIILANDTNATGHNVSASKFWGEGSLLSINGSANPVNLVNNGNFELWNSGVTVAPDGWTLVGANATSERESSIKKIGSYSANVTMVTNPGVLYQDFTADKGVDYWKGRNVTFGAWVYTGTASSAQLVIEDDAGASTSVAYHPGDSVWHWLTATRQIASNATFASAECEVDLASSAYFDGAMITEGNYSFAFAESPLDILKSSPGSIRFQVDLTLPYLLNASQTQRNTTSTVFYFNGEPATYTLRYVKALSSDNNTNFTLYKSFNETDVNTTNQVSMANFTCNIPIAGGWINNTTSFDNATLESGRYLIFEHKPSINETSLHIYGYATR